MISLTQTTNIHKLQLVLSRKEGRNEGTKEGRKEGTKEGRKEVRKEGSKEGRKEGRKVPHSVRKVPWNWVPVPL